MLKIATWNVNSVRQRIEHLAHFLKTEAPDVLCLQEIKCVDEAFPLAEVEACGYNSAVHGQKTFNGVALLSKRPFDEVIRGLPGDAADDQSRYIEGVLSIPGGALRVASIYLPNGNPAPGPKYDYKLAWMDRLTAHARGLLAHEELLVLAGDYNVIPEAADARHPELWTEDALFRPETRTKFRTLENLGFTDAFRAADAAPGRYSFWDYQAGAWQKDNGIRIDHLMLSPQALDRLESAAICKDMRGREKPSDHVPVMVELRV